VDLKERRGSVAQRHPWEVVRAEFFLQLLARCGLLQTDGDWLDVGSGDAWFGRQLRRLLPREAELTCWDINYTPEDLATVDQSGSEGMTLVAERPNGRFDRILMLDVIEHVEDDAAFVQSTVGDLLTEGGIALISVPAYQALFSSHDKMLCHHRRYSPAACRRLLEHSGLAVLADGGLFFSLLPVRAAQVILEQVRPLKSLSTGIGDWQGGKVATRVLTRGLIMEAKLSLSLGLRGHSLPGLSYWALCRFQGR
jgi:2-polyprenyl-3-methyl-5-hydroxy-6-metoxy-1,4-benzoquinol methylase